MTDQARDLYFRLCTLRAVQPYDKRLALLCDRAYWRWERRRLRGRAG